MLWSLSSDVHRPSSRLTTRCITWLCVVLTAQVAARGRALCHSDKNTMVGFVTIIFPSSSLVKRLWWRQLEVSCLATFSFYCMSITVDLIVRCYLDLKKRSWQGLCLGFENNWHNYHDTPCLKYLFWVNTLCSSILVFMCAFQQKMLN